MVSGWKTKTLLIAYGNESSKMPNVTVDYCKLQKWKIKNCVPGPIQIEKRGKKLDTFESSQKHLITLYCTHRNNNQKIICIAYGNR